ncbi:unnamed protein product [Hermetia illucens]|uniref:chitinase n=1 Tax=Hermetia illucens TaxID=343691 RepID=A0A7R8UAX0_HERIL|nr:acidic mammalian chitinase-like isoform X1 [Hermetia illucens]CAD7077407.1 unnamed protein product [Hermetia illucens]
MVSKLVLLGLVLCGQVLLGIAATDKIFCYYGSWSVYRNSAAQLPVNNIEPALCTHAIYAHAGLDTRGTMIPMDVYNDVTNGAYTKFVKLKERNSSLKVLISLGGWNEGSKKYSDVVASASLRSSLVNSIASFISKYGFDGINIDWEYPTQRGGSSSDYSNFAQFLTDLRVKLGPNLLITIMVSGQATLISSAYDVQRINNQVDYIHIIAYEFNSAYVGRTAQHAALNALNPSDTLNVNFAVQSWLSAGASAEKLILGIAAYGRSYTLANANNRFVGATTSGPGPAGPYTNAPGTLSYLEICKEQLNGGWTVAYDGTQKNPYMYKGTTWVGFDNQESVTLKTEFAISYNLGGVYLWSLDLDDVNNACGGGRFSLLRAAKAALDAGNENPVISECEAGDVKRDETDCTVYYVCLKSDSGLYEFAKRQCLYGLYFDITRNLCNHPSVVDC